MADVNGPTQTPEPAAPRPRRSIGRGIAIGVGIAVLVLAVAGLAAYLLSIQVSVPNVTGKQRLDAITQLQLQGLKVGTVTEAKSATAAAGTVVGQDPAAGSKSIKGASVNLITAPHYQAIPVPNIQGRDATAAIQIVTGSSLVPAPYSMFSTSAPAGMVIGQVPNPGTRVGKGTQVAIPISLGLPPASQKVPQVIGTDATEAKKQLDALGFGAHVVETFSSSVGDGQVMDQFPDAGTEAVPGAVVGIQVSKGASGDQSVTVPKFVGMPEPQVIQAIKDAGLGINTFAEFSTTVPRGSAVGQLPAAGSKVAASTVVAVAFSLGPAPESVLVPDLSGMQAKDATLTLETIGLRTVVTPVYSTQSAKGLVSVQLPLGDTHVAPNTPIAIAVSMGPSAEQNSTPAPEPKM
jgi:beta-lactam-binding protein with PASTA domain